MNAELDGENQNEKENISIKKQDSARKRLPMHKISSDSPNVSRY